MKNYYEILEVNENASKEIISKVFKMQIKKNHPDLFQGEEKQVAEEKTMLLNEAYEILSDEIKREKYDKTLNFEKEEQVNYLKNEINILKEELIKKQAILQQIKEEIGIDNYMSNLDKQNCQKEDTSHIYGDIQNSVEYNGRKGNYSDLKSFLLKILVFFLAIIFVLFILGQIIDKNILGELFIRLFSK